MLNESWVSYIFWFPSLLALTLPGEIRGNVSLTDDSVSLRESRGARQPLKHHTCAARSRLSSERVAREKLILHSPSCVLC